MNDPAQEGRVFLRCGPALLSYRFDEMCALFAFARAYGWEFPWDQSRFLDEIHKGFVIPREDANLFANALSRGRSRNSDRELATNWFGRPGWKQRLLGIVSAVHGNKTELQLTRDSTLSQ